MKKNKKRDIKITINILFLVVILICIAFGWFVLTHQKNGYLLPDLYQNHDITDVIMDLDRLRPVPRKELVLDYMDINQTSGNETDDLADLNNSKYTNTNSIRSSQLAIIIDDISSISQLNIIEKLDMNITPSIFPPTKHHLYTDKMAKNLEFYMIHLPLEAINFYSEEVNTIKIGFNQSEIDSVIAGIRTSFPKAIFINNHTGSKFTSNYNAMKKLFVSLKKYNFIFLDSKTINSDVSKKLSLEFGQRYIYRDIFLDNVDDVTEILMMIDKAIKLSKNRGYAIAIAHPKPNTFKALKMAKNKIKNSGIELVFVKDIYENYK